MHRLPHPCLILLLLLAAACERTGSQIPSPAPESEAWVRVGHPQLPLSFDAPPKTFMRTGSIFSLGGPRSNDRRRIEVTLFGVRPLADRAASMEAVQFGFYWVTQEFLGVEADTLASMSERLADAGAIEAFLRATFYQRQQVELHDLGRDFVDGYPARRFAIARTFARGTRDERQVGGEVIVIPFSALATLTLIARFDERSTPDERGALFPRVFRSLRFDHTGSGPLEARVAMRRLL